MAGRKDGRKESRQEGRKVGRLMETKETIVGKKRRRK